MMKKHQMYLGNPRKLCSKHGCGFDHEKDDGGFDDKNEVEKETLRFSGSSARPAYPLGKRSR